MKKLFLFLFAATAMAQVRIYQEPGHILLTNGATINVSADAQSGTLSVEMDGCEPSAPTNLVARLEL